MIIVSPFIGSYVTQKEAINKKLLFHKILLANFSPFQHVSQKYFYLLKLNLYKWMQYKGVHYFE